MLYSCKACGRGFDSSEGILFCPFCGTAYQDSAPAQQETTTRIVIGSDSERTVQEKYWELTRGEIFELRIAWSAKIPDLRDFDRARIRVPWWDFSSRRCTSNAELARRCDQLLAKIGEYLQSKQPVRPRLPIVDLPQQIEYIDATCSAMEKALGQPVSPRPVFAYTPPEPAQKTEESPEPWRKLWETVESVKPRLYALSGEYGLFAVRPPQAEWIKENDEEDDEELPILNPEKLSADLLRLSKQPYDPLFDDDCGEFSQLFWKSVEQLAPAVNRICGLTALIAQEHAKISALGDYMNAWQERLRLTLDRVYQAQREDMLTVYTRAQQVLQDAAARPDNSGE